MRVPFFNYKNYCKEIDYKSLLEDVLETGFLIGGPFVDEVESEMQSITGIKHCICVGNATDAMEIIFKFLNLPVGSDVLIPTHTMLATASAAKSVGLNPVPMEVSRDTLMTEFKQLQKCSLNNVSACMITQLNGVVANMDPINEYCKLKGISLIEDSAQGIGAFNKNNHAGSWGVGGCISFYPAKVIGSLGDGGAIITNNSELNKYARSVRDHGRGEGFEAINWGRNSRLDSLNARVVLERLRKLNKYISKRRYLASIYDELLLPLVDDEVIKLPPKYSTNSKSLSTYQNYEIQVKRRDELMDFLKLNDIGTIKQWGGYSISHFKKLGYSIDEFPSTKLLFEKLLLLPLNHLMKEEEIRHVANKIKSFFK